MDRMPVRVLIADDHPVVRAGLRAGLIGYDIEVVGEAENGGSLLGLVATVPCDITLIDIRLPGIDGLETLARLRNQYPTLPAVLMTGYDNPSFVYRAITLGAAGYITKNCSLAKQAEMLRIAATGTSTFTRDDLRRVTGALATPRLGPEYEVPLTHRECEVLVRLGEGLTNKQIAERMKISYETVKEHVQHILQKIGVVDRTQAVYWGLRNGVIPLEDDGPPPGRLPSH
jgi:DNA-binding NarL/FixJ family response regulator